MTDQLQRDPQDWKTGDEPMTEAQASYLRTLSDEVGEPFDEALTKAQASQRIDELRDRSPRVSGSNASAASDAADESTPPRPSQAEGGDAGVASGDEPGAGEERAPKPSQAEGERLPE